MMNQTIGTFLGGCNCNDDVELALTVSNLHTVPPCLASQADLYSLTVNKEQFDSFTQIVPTPKDALTTDMKKLHETLNLEHLRGLVVVTGKKCEDLAEPIIGLMKDRHHHWIRFSIPANADGDLSKVQSGQILTITDYVVLQTIQASIKPFRSQLQVFAFETEPCERRDTFQEGDHLFFIPRRVLDHVLNLGDAHSERKVGLGEAVAKLDLSQLQPNTDMEETHVEFINAELGYASLERRIITYHKKDDQAELLQLTIPTNCQCLETAKVGACLGTVLPPSKLDGLNNKVPTMVQVNPSEVESYINWYRHNVPAIREYKESPDPSWVPACLLGVIQAHVKKHIQR